MGDDWKRFEVEFTQGNSEILFVRIHDLIFALEEKFDIKPPIELVDYRYMLGNIIQGEYFIKLGHGYISVEDLGSGRCKLIFNSNLEAWEEVKEWWFVLKNALKIMGGPKKVLPTEQKPNEQVKKKREGIRKIGAEDDRRKLVKAYKDGGKSLAVFLESTSVSEIWPDGLAGHPGKGDKALSQIVSAGTFWNYKKELGL